MVFFEKIILYMLGNFLDSIFSTIKFFWFLHFSGEPIILMSCWFPRFVRKGIYKFILVRTCVRSLVTVLQPGPLNFFWFFAWCCVSIWLRWPQKIFWSKNFLTPKMAKNGQNLAIFGQNSRFECFWPISSNAAINFHNFWYGNYPCGLLWENHTLYAGKILISRNFGHFRPKFGHFWPKLTVLRVLTYNFQMLPNPRCCWIRLRGIN